MPVYALGDIVPRIDATAWVADDATVVGDVSMGPGASLWFGSIVRGDNSTITIGPGSNVQDGSVLHTDAGIPLTLGANVTVGHMVMLHGCTVGDGTLIGIQSVILNHARIGRNCLVGAGSLVTEGKEFPDGSLIVGRPAKVVRALTEAQIADLQRAAKVYVDNAVRYRAGLKRIA